jgi:hypothetical protein
MVIPIGFEPMTFPTYSRDALSSINFSISFLLFQPLMQIMEQGIKAGEFGFIKLFFEYRFGKQSKCN